MATQRPISTISYNTVPFLTEKLEQLVKAHKIQCYAFVCHKGEDGDKDHIHVIVYPNVRLDPMQLSDMLREYVPGHEKPLGVRPWRPSKEEDWTLYVLHDQKYLRSKGETGKIPYSVSDIHASEDFDIDTLVRRAYASIEHSVANVHSRLRSGESASDLMDEGISPFMLSAMVNADIRGGEVARLHRVNERLSSQLNVALRKLTAVSDAGYDFEEDGDGRFKLVATDSPF